MINCYAIVEKCNLEVLAEYLTKYPLTRLVGQYNGNSLRHSDIIGLSVQVVFLDYSLYHKFRQLILELEPHVSIVYFSNNPDAAYQAFEDGVLDYITYPYNFARLEKCMNKFVRFSLLIRADQQREKATSVESFFVKPDPRGKEELLINCDDVLFIEAFQNDVAIQMSDGRRFVCFHTMKEMEGSLSNNFMRVHKSFIINYRKISAFDGSNIIIEKNQRFKIPLGGVYKQSFLDRRNTMVIRKPQKGMGVNVLKKALGSLLIFLAKDIYTFCEIFEF